MVIRIDNMASKNYNTICSAGFNNDQTDCMEMNEDINIIKEGGNCPINNTIELEFDYNLNQRFNCSDGITLTKIDPYKYRFNIICKFYQFG